MDQSSYQRRREVNIKDINSLPLAMAYVPWQEWGSIYTPEEALHQGTIFKNLDLPFLGRRCDRL